MRVHLLGATGAALMAACTVGSSGIGEPLRVRGAVFHVGAFPAATGQSRVTLIELQTAALRPGELAHGISGRTSADAGAVALSLADAEGAAGYWLMPVSGPDAAADGELTWQTTLDVGHDLTPGPHTLTVAALDAEGRAGPPETQSLCVLRPVPDNLNACNNKLVPPAIVVSLDWDTDVDLDLVAIGADGKRVDAKHPTTAPVVAGAVAPGALADATVGRIDTDSNGACVIDARRRENLVWKEAPATGTARILVDLFSGCGRSSAHYRVTVWRRQAHADGTYALVAEEPYTGSVVSLQADGGAGPATAVLELSFP
jgi:hypothetical protein